MIKPVGGRGKKAPYLTVTMRVPQPIAEKVQSLIEGYRTSVISGLITQDDLRKLEPWRSEYTSVSKSEAIEKTKEILKQKQSAKKSLLKLLQVLYGEEVNL
jgi:high-affinity Fe2+/Pb2+ permease